MNEQTEPTTKDDRLVAAISHAGLLIPTMGLLIPLVVWITQKDRSAYLRKQALQAAIWQLLAFLVQILAMGCYFFSFFLFIPVGMFLESDKFYIDPASGGALAGGIIILFFLVILLYFLGGLVYLVFGITGIVQTLKGKDFQYPFIGRWVNNRLTTDAQIRSDADNLQPAGADE